VHAEEPLPVSRDHRRIDGPGAAGVVHHAGVVVAVEQRPLRRHPLRGHHVFHVRDLRRALRDYRQQPRIVDLDQRQSVAGRGCDLPAQAALRHAVAGLLAGDHRARRVVDVGSRAACARRRGGDMSVPSPAPASVESGFSGTIPTVSRTTAIVAADHVSKWYGQVIGLNDVSVSVPQGVTGLLGPNGAGKSTFMKLITGQLKPSKGSVHVMGEPIWRNPHLYFQIGFCPEQDAFYERMTGLEWVRALVRLNGLSDQEADAAARRALTAVDLMEAADKKIGAYSKGMRQR